MYRQKKPLLSILKKKKKKKKKSTFTVYKILWLFFSVVKLEG